MSEINDTTPIHKGLLAQTNSEDYSMPASHYKGIRGTQITPVENKKTEVIHDPYWSMIHRRKNMGNQTPRVNTDPNLMTIMEVANLLRVAPLTLKRWEKKGHIKAIRINSRGDRRYLRSEINKLLGGNV